LLQSSPTPATVGILFNPLIFLAGGNTVTVGRNPILSMQGVYESLWSLNIPVDFIHVDNAASGGLSHYNLVYVPFALALNSSVANALADWVRSGGKLIAEARTGWTDESGNTGIVIANHTLSGDSNSFLSPTNSTAPTISSVWSC
jgi:beta-galactosidase GanA